MFQHGHVIKSGGWKGSEHLSLGITAMDQQMVAQNPPLHDMIGNSGM